MTEAAAWKYCLPVSALLFCLLFTLPLLAVEGSSVRLPQLPAEENAEPVTLLPPGEVDSSYSVRVLDGGTVRSMPMSEYLQGVVRAEMPASFEQEALCAQAVAARTYTLYKMAAGSAHPEADVCTDYACCQAYRTAEEAAAAWGDDAERYEAKIRNAVASTDGAAIVWGGVPVLAVFHSSSSGRTRGSGEVWSGDLPYLQSVSSPESGEIVPNYYSRAEVDGEEFKAVFLAAHPEAVFPADPAAWITDPAVTAGGSVDTVTVGGVTVRGVELRRLYGLRSASFEAEARDGKIVFYVTGYGHGVGMSQYGANAMAAAGSSWRDIILHYYTGVTIETRGR